MGYRFGPFYLLRCLFIVSLIILRLTVHYLVHPSFDIVSFYVNIITGIDQLNYMETIVKYEEEEGVR